MEPCFHEDSYGYRPGKSALDAVGVARQRCWRYAWVLDLDIQSFFDQSIRVCCYGQYVNTLTVRGCFCISSVWLKAPIQMADDSLIARERGVPQGGVISPVLSNLFLHYTFDMWMARNHPTIPFERYADDGICHCRSEEQARTLRALLEIRFAQCGLTRIRTRQKSSIARTMIDAVRTRTKVRLPRLYVPAAVIAPMERVRRLVQSGGQRQSSQVDPADRPPLDAPPAQRQDAR